MRTLLKAGMSVNEIARQIGRSIVYVESRIAINSLPWKLRRRVGSGLTVTSALAIARLEKEKQEQIAKTILTGRTISDERVNRQIARVKETVPMHKCPKCGEEFPCELAF